MKMFIYLKTRDYSCAIPLTIITVPSSAVSSLSLRVAAQQNIRRLKITVTNKTEQLYTTPTNYI